MSAIFTAVSSETETVFTMPSINYYAIAPILILFGCGRRLRPGGGIRPPPGPPPDAARAGVRLDHRGARRRHRPSRHPARHGRGRHRDRRAHARHAGHPPGDRPAGRAPLRGALDRPPGRRVRPAGLGAAGLRGRAAVHPARVPADGDLAVPAVRPDRHARVPGRQRPAPHVRGPRGHVAAAVPAGRHGASSTPPVAGGRAQVLPARRVLLRVLPVRRGDALRLQRLDVAGRHRRHPLGEAERGCPRRRRHGPHRGRAALQGGGRAVPPVDPGRLPGLAHRR